MVHSLLGRHYTEAEWEALCDGCGECCFESNWSGSQWVDGSRACRYLDLESRRCWVYGQRFEAEKDCVRVSPEVVLQDILPVNCAYRKLAERIIDEDYSGYDGSADGFVAFWANTRPAVGAELIGDVVVGWGALITGRIGYGLGLGSGAYPGGHFYAQLGASF